MSLVPLLVACAFDLGPHVVPKDPDLLPPGAKARLGSARYVVPNAWNAPPVLSPDGKLVAVFVYSGFRVSHINVYDAETRRLLRTLRLKIRYDLHWIRFVSATRILAGDSMNHGTPLQTFDTETGRCEVILNDPKSPAALCASDDARVLVDYDYTIWRTNPLRKAHTIRPVHLEQQDTQNEPKLSANGATLLITTRARTGTGDEYLALQLWDTATGKEYPLVALDDVRSVWAVELSPDGKQLAVLTNWRLQLFDTATGKVRAQFPVEGEKGAWVGFDHTGGRVFVASPARVIVFAAETGKCVGAFRVPPALVPSGVAPRQVGITADGKVRVFGDLYSGRGVWDAATGRAFGNSLGHGQRVTALSFSPDGSLLTSVSEDWERITEDTIGGASLTWDLSKRTPLDPQPRGLPCDPDREGTWFAWRSHDNSRALLNRSSTVLLGLDDRAPARVELPPTFGVIREVGGAAFSPDGRNLLGYHCNQETEKIEGVALYDTATGKAKFTIPVKNLSIVGLSFNADGSFLVLRVNTGHGDKPKHELLCIDTRSGEVLNRRVVPEAYEQVLALADDSTVLRLCQFSNRNRSEIVAVDASTGKTLRSWSSKEMLWSDGNLEPNLATVSHDRALLACATNSPRPGFWHFYQTTIRVLDTDTLTERAAFSWPWEVHEKFGPGVCPTAFAFSRDNRTLAVGLSNGTILLYDVPPAKKK